MISTRKTTWKLVCDAQKVWPHLNGIMCIYKPSGLTVNQTRLTIISNLCRGKNTNRITNFKLTLTK